MAIALFIPGSLFGLLIALAMSVLFGATPLVALATYCAFAFGTPIAGLVAAYISCALKRHAAAHKDVALHNA
jgi:hypothetical protein